MQEQYRTTVRELHLYRNYLTKMHLQYATSLPRDFGPISCPRFSIILISPTAKKFPIFVMENFTTAFIKSPMKHIPNQINPFHCFSLCLSVQMFLICCTNLWGPVVWRSALYSGVSDFDFSYTYLSPHTFFFLSSNLLGNSLNNTSNQIIAACLKANTLFHNFYVWLTVLLWVIKTLKFRQHKFTVKKTT